MVRVLFSVLALLVSAVHGQNQQTTPMPPSITAQPTDLLTTGSFGGLTIVTLATQGFAVEYSVTGTSQNSYINVPCTATANPQNIKYQWYKWNPQATIGSKWQALTPGAKYAWSTQQNGDPATAGQLAIKPFDKVADAGQYVCWAVTDYGTAVSDVLNLTTAVFPGEGQQASLQQRNVVVGDYLKLDAPYVAAVPALNASWTRTTTRDVPAGIGSEIPSDRVVMDETGALHIGYVDSSLVQVATATGLANYNYFHFKCMSLRYVMTDLAVFQLTLSGSTPTTASCVLKYQTPSLNLVHGQSSRIACAYAGSPSIKVTYQKLTGPNTYQPLTTVVVGGDPGSAVIQTGLYGNTYMIGAAQPTDAGTYQCLANFPGGTCQGVNTPIVVTVDLEPIFIAQPSPIVYVVEGRSVTLEWRVKGRPKPVFELGQNGQTTISGDAKVTGTEPIPIIDPADNYTIYIRTMKLSNAVKPVDSRSVQLYATNMYYSAVSSVSITVISPITFPTKMAPQLNLAPGSVATFTCTAQGDDALPLSIGWARVSTAAITYPIASSTDDGQFSMVDNAVPSTSGFNAISSTLTVSTAKGHDLDSSRGTYVCNVTNGITSNVASGRLSFIGDDPMAASFEMWMLGPILGGVAAILLVVGIIIVVRRNRGEKYEVEDEEIKKGYDPKKEAHEQRELREYQRDREKDSSEPLRQSHPDAEIEQDEA